MTFDSDQGTDVAESSDPDAVAPAVQLSFGPQPGAVNSEQLADVIKVSTILEIFALQEDKRVTCSCTLPAFLRVYHVPHYAVHA